MALLTFPITFSDLEPITFSDLEALSILVDFNWFVDLSHF
jgi:hypothetical protein